MGTGASMEWWKYATAGKDAPAVQSRVLLKQNQKYFGVLASADLNGLCKTRIKSRHRAELNKKVMFRLIHHNAYPD